MNLNQLLSVSYWMQSRPGDLSTPFEVLFLVVLIVMYGLYLAARYMQKKEDEVKNRIYAQYWEKFMTFSSTMAITFTFIFFFRYEAVPFLGGRYWTLMWVIITLIWAGILTYRYVRVLPKLARERQERLSKLGK